MHQMSLENQHTGLRKRIVCFFVCFCCCYYYYCCCDKNRNYKKSASKYTYKRSRIAYQLVKERKCNAGPVRRGRYENSNNNSTC